MLIVHTLYPKYVKGELLETLVDSVIADVPLYDSIGYAGYMTKNYLKEFLLWRYENHTINDYQGLEETKRNNIEEIVRATIRRCAEVLQTKSGDVHTFIFPWFPDEQTRKTFNGVMGWVDYKDTILLFIHPDFLEKDLIETVAHEYNHAVWYGMHNGEAQTLFDSLIIEGLAEHFRERVVGGERAPWCSLFANRKEFELSLEKIKPLLYRTDMYDAVFFGNDVYQKWTGYSLGYWLVGDFLNDHAGAEWKEIMRDIKTFKL